MGSETPGVHDAHAKIVNVVDGDSYDAVLLVFADVYLGSEKKPEELRLLHVDTHESWGEDEDSEEYKRAMEEEAFVVGWIDYGRGIYDGEYPFKLKVSRDEDEGSFGRWLVHKLVRKGDGAELNRALLNNFDGIRNDG